MRRKRPAPNRSDGQRRLKRIARDLCTAAGLDPANLSTADRIRIDQAAFATLCRDNLQAKALAGAVVDVGELERINAALDAIIPKSAPTLNVQFITNMARCSACGHIAPETVEEIERHAARELKSNPPRPNNAR